MSGVITAGEILKSGSIGFWLVGSRTTPAALQIASHKPDALAFVCTNGSTANPKIVAPAKIAATAATLRTTQGSFRESGASSLIAAPRHRPQGPPRQGGRRAAKSDNRSW